MQLVCPTGGCLKGLCNEIREINLPFTTCMFRQIHVCTHLFLMTGSHLHSEIPLKVAEQRSQKYLECTIQLHCFQNFLCSSEMAFQRASKCNNYCHYFHISRERMAYVKLPVITTCTDFLIAVSNIVSNSDIIHASLFSLFLFSSK